MILIEVEIGNLGFWPVGDASGIFFGQTPDSHNDKPRACNQLNISGGVTVDISGLITFKSG